MKKEIFYIVIKTDRVVKFLPRLHLGGDEWPIYMDPTGADNILSGRETTTVQLNPEPLKEPVSILK